MIDLHMMCHGSKGQLNLILREGADKKNPGRHLWKSDLKLSPQVANWGRWKEAAANAKAQRCETSGDTFYNSDRVDAFRIKECEPELTVVTTDMKQKETNGERCQKQKY